MQIAIVFLGILIAAIIGYLIISKKKAEAEGKEIKELLAKCITHFEVRLDRNNKEVDKRLKTHKKNVKSYVKAKTTKAVKSIRAGGVE